jgi:hypothetical protein
LQERTRALAGGVSLQPDALVQLEREETTSFVSPLYPYVKTCPHHGCWNFMFRCASESFRHEQVFHPAERKQRLVDDKGVLGVLGVLGV